MYTRAMSMFEYLAVKIRFLPV